MIEKICKNCGQSKTLGGHVFDEAILSLRDEIVRLERNNQIEKASHLRKLFHDQMYRACEYGWNGHVYNPEDNLQFLERKYEEKINGR